ncbi:MAG: hypothetical protein ACPL28_10460 [bacterium]
MIFLQLFIYSKENKLICAVRCDNGWQKEVIESGFRYYSFSLVFDNRNTAHISYYRWDTTLNKLYLCYSHRDSSGWSIDVVDSNIYWRHWYALYTSIDIDTFGKPGIAYITWNLNLTDSICYIKYAHYNGANWDTSVVEYDSMYVHIQSMPDWNPSLKFNKKNTPMIAFNQLYHYQYEYDTVKIGYYDDTLDRWIVSPAIYWPPMGQPSLSLELDNQDFPHIALCRNGTLAHAWWDGSEWQIESVNAISIGDYGAIIDLELDSLNNPHIAFQGDMLTPFPDYCYYDGTWHSYIPFDDSLLLHPRGGISIVLDNTSSPHIAYACGYYNGNTDMMAITSNMPKEHLGELVK